ncbi:unnamed protein product [Moneuplotes crassus]|uniref:Uncharacterized protein n=1 Tax=Euplotes crassus TaxID=5936 RepID=A0AAD1UFL8_EUPCR|nr:unnamed protein product [Moneuplotes crassus]
MVLRGERGESQRRRTKEKRVNIKFSSLGEQLRRNRKTGFRNNFNDEIVDEGVYSGVYKLRSSRATTKSTQISIWLNKKMRSSKEPNCLNFSYDNISQQTHESFPEHNFKKTKPLNLKRPKPPKKTLKTSKSEIFQKLSSLPTKGMHVPPFLSSKSHKFLLQLQKLQPLFIESKGACAEGIGNVGKERGKCGFGEIGNVFLPKSVAEGFSLSCIKYHGKFEKSVEMRQLKVPSKRRLLSIPKVIKEGKSKRSNKRYHVTKARSSSIQKSNSLSSLLKVNSSKLLKFKNKYNINSNALKFQGRRQSEGGRSQLGSELLELGQKNDYDDIGQLEDLRENVPLKIFKSPKILVKHKKSQGRFIMKGGAKYEVLSTSKVVLSGLNKYK